MKASQSFMPYLKCEILTGENKDFLTS